MLTYAIYCDRYISLTSEALILTCPECMVLCGEWSTYYDILLIMSVLRS